MSKGILLSIPIAVSLLVPACLLGARVWLTGSAIPGELKRERASAATELRAIASVVEGKLVEKVLEPGPGRVVLRLDAERRVQAPFVRWTEPRSLDDDTELQFALARSLAREGRIEDSRKLLATARGVSRDTAPIPYALLVDLLDASLSAATGDRAIARDLRRRLLAGEVLLPAAATRPVLALLRELAPVPEDDEQAEIANSVFRDAARLASLLEDGHMRPPTSGSSLVVPTAATLVVIHVETTRALLKSLLTDASATFTIDLDSRESIADEAVVTAFVSLHAHFKQPPASARLATLAGHLLWLACLAFVLGNLWTLRAWRHEQRLSRMKSTFIDLVSHELRTPLQALALKTEMLAAGDVPQAQLADYHVAANDAVLRLSAVLRRILDFARLEKGARAHTHAALLVRPFLARCVRESKPLLREHGHRLVIRAERALPPLSGDAELLACAVRNLLENAAKYSTPSSTISLTAHVERGSLRIAIGDAGPGVAEAERAAIFEPFTRGTAAQASQTFGSGLGLAIVGEAARAHAGSIEVENRPEGGALFTLVVPCSA